jgi:tRNA pseudouridine55 synthase
VRIINKNNSLTKSEIIDLANSEGVLLLIDKQKDWTSFDVVAKVRNFFKIKKVGHAGTLDPAATGLLILGLGKGTKKLTELTSLKKSYSGTIKFGATTKTDDAEAEEENILDNFTLNETEVLEHSKKFLGKIKQIPPKFSAKKIKGKKMYDLARKGIEFERKEVELEIFDFKISNINDKTCDFYIECSKGTYIRAIARDLGESLGLGGYLLDLRREKIDDFSVEDAHNISELIESLK